MGGLSSHRIRARFRRRVRGYIVDGARKAGCKLKRFGLVDKVQIARQLGFRGALFESRRLAAPTVVPVPIDRGHHSPALQTFYPTFGY